MRTSARLGAQRSSLSAARMAWNGMGARNNGNGLLHVVEWTDARHICAILSLLQGLIFVCVYFLSYPFLCL